MIAYVIVFDEYDSYDIGTHDAVLDMFEHRPVAERVMAELAGKPKERYRGSPLWGSSDQLHIEEWPIR